MNKLIINYIALFLFSFSNLFAQFVDRELNDLGRQHYSLNAGIKSELETHRRKISSLSEKLDAFQHKFHSIEHVDKQNFMAKNSSKMELQKPPSKKFHKWI